jgi:hypothetical protein
MLQIKQRKRRYCNTAGKRKAAFHGRGFKSNFITKQKVMNLTNPIIRQNLKNEKNFSRRRTKGGESYE